MTGIPFANGTEGQAWMDKWCDVCAEDHEVHSEAGGGCSYIGGAMMADDHWEWPPVWLPEPDDREFHLPSRMVCLAYRPCEPCGGDPAPDQRKALVQEVALYWKERTP